MPDKIKVFISTSTFAEYDKEPLELLKAKGISYELNPHKRRLSEEEIENILRDSDYRGLIAGTEPLTGNCLQKSSYLKVISRVGTGLDNIDLACAKKLKIKVYNTPDVLTDAVAELTIGLVISCLRRVVSMDRNIRHNFWVKEMGTLLKGKTLGIIGCGRIGKRVARLAGAFGAKVLAYDFRDIGSKTIKQVSLKSLLSQSQIISIHASARKPIITEEHVNNMKKTPILIKTSRGAVMSEDVLYKALVGGKIAYAALDVFETEPYKGKLCGLDNVILTPHIGSYAREVRLAMEKEAVRNLIRGLKV